ncbi:hypothetical protein [Streptomyces sp. NPDC058671]|uniref:hypothetical protein n=1 Tax=Streptomyces sp. NPDC058671 TaxID=3346590 RepID=UPI00364915A8
MNAWNNRDSNSVTVPPRAKLGTQRRLDPTPRTSAGASPVRGWVTLLRTGGGAGFGAYAPLVSA